MSAGNPDRARRVRKAVDYDEDASKQEKQIEDAFQESGMHDQVAKMKADSKKNHAKEKAAAAEADKRALEEDPDVDPAELEHIPEEEDSDFEYEDDYDEQGNVIGRKKRVKSEAEIEQEKYIAHRWGIAYPEQFNSTKKGAEMAYHAICAGNATGTLNMAYDRAFPEAPLSVNDKNRVIEYVRALKENVTVPEEELITTFSEYAKVNGGRFAKTSEHFNMMVAMSLMAPLVDYLVEYRANGSAQEQGFAALLANAGLHGDAAQLIATTFSTDTPLDSTYAEGRKMAEQLNALDDNTKVQAVYRMLCELKVIARKHGYISGGAGGYDRTHFDEGRAKNAGERASKKGYCMVGVHLLHRNQGELLSSTRRVNHRDKGTEWRLADAKSDELGTFYGEASLPKNTNYQPFNALTRDDLKINDERDCESATYKAASEKAKQFNAKYAKDKDDPRSHWNTLDTEHFVPPPVVTHRAQLTVYEPTPDNIIGAVKTLLTDEAKAPKLAAYVKEIAEPVEYPGTELPFKKNTAYACIRYNPAGFTPIGKKTPRSRCVDDSLSLALPEKWHARASALPVPKWFEIGEGVDTEEMASLLCPPWKAYEYGEVNVYILLSEHPPIDVLSLPEARARQEKKLHDAKTKRYEADIKRAWLVKAKAKGQIKQRDATVLDSGTCTKMHPSEIERMMKECKKQLNSKQAKHDLEVNAMMEAKNHAYTIDYDFDKRGVWPVHTYIAVEATGNVALPPYAPTSYDTEMAQAPPESNSGDGMQGLYTNGQVKAAKRRRLGQEKKGEMVQNALSVQEEEYSFAPGGAVAEAAAASFAAASGASSSTDAA